MLITKRVCQNRHILFILNNVIPLHLFDVLVILGVVTLHGILRDEDRHAVELLFGHFKVGVEIAPSASGLNRRMPR